MGFSLHNVTGDWKNTHLRAEQVDCVQPLIWLSRKLSPTTNQSPALVMTNAVLVIQERTNFPSAPDKGSLSQTLDDVATIGLALKNHLLDTHLTNCSIQIHSTPIELPSADWNAGRLTAQARFTNSPRMILVAAEIENRHSMALSIKSDPVALQGKLTSRSTNDWTWEGHLNWLTNRADVVAQFATNSWWPTHANLNAQELHFPADLVRLPGYESLTTTLAIDVVSNQFDLKLTGFALPLAQSNGLPRIEATLRAKGDPDSATLDQLHIAAPWMQADLTNSIGIKRSGELLANAARLNLSLDLAKLPGINAAGIVSGLVSVELREDRQPIALFDLAATGTRIDDWEAKRLLLQGDFKRPLLTLKSLVAELADGSDLHADGSADLSSKELHNAKWKASGKFVERLVPDLTYTKLDATGSVQGPFTNLSHTGSVSVQNLQNQTIKPLALELTWNGTNLFLSTGKATASAGESTLEVEGQFDLRKNKEFEGALKKLSLTRNKKALYALAKPSSILFRQNLTQSNSHSWSLVVGDFDWRGDDRNVMLSTDLRWPTTGTLQASAKRVELRDAADFFKTDLGNIVLSNLNMNAGWSNSPVHSTIVAAGTITDEPGNAFVVDGKISTDDRIQIEQLTVGSRLAPALHIQANLPAKVVPSPRGDWFVLDKQSPISLTADSQTTNQALSVSLGSLGRLQITNATVHLQASGTLQKPNASITVGVVGIDWQSPTNTDQRRPKLEQFALSAEVQPDLIKVRQLTGKIDGQQIRAFGEWPLPTGFWLDLLTRKKPPDWSQARGQLKIEEANVAVIAHYLPQILAPEGQVRVDLSLSPGGQFGGTLLLTNAATRPFGSIAPVREISARVRLENSKAILEEFRGEMGGQPIRATGFVTIPLEGNLDYQVSLQGKNIPFVRSVEFLLRGDLNVELKGGKDSAPSLTGDITLRDGLLVEYASEFMWSKPRRPELQPPYFSIAEEPFRNWKLGLAVHGDKFLRMRTPFFNGVISANGKLEGTLAEPIVSGDARIDSGRIIFPFGALNVDQGYANLNRNDPRGPRLYVNASGRNFSYNIHLEVKGPADGADILFTSAPALTSEEILLMLTAGEMPQGQGRFTYSTQDRAGQLATFVGKDLFSRFSGSGTTEERLTFSTGENVTAEGRLTYSAEYRLSDRWSIIGEYDQFGAFNAYLKWKVLSR